MLLVIFYLFLSLPVCLTDMNCRPRKDCNDLEQHLQPQEVLELNDETCTRDCNKGSPRICFYKFYLEEYKTVSEACGNCTSKVESDCFEVACVPADGYERGFLSVNRRLPGPSIQVCYGDRIVVDVINMTPGQDTTIHWHGQWQKGTQYNDGVPMVTQCPILGGNVFRYDYYANNSGTFFYHSHTGHQKIDGWQGPLVVRRGSKDPSAHLYDKDLPEHVIFLQDWHHLDAGQHYPGLMTYAQSQNPRYLLINGLGKYRMKNHTLSSTPLKVFTVTSGVKYRFRLIGALSQCAAMFCIEGHTLLVIATDGISVKPVKVSCITIHSGERYDFVLDAKSEKSAYWMQFTAMDICEGLADPQFAVLRYGGANMKDEPPPFDHPLKMNGVTLNPINQTQTAQAVTVDQLETVEYVPKAMRISSSHEHLIPIVFGYYFPETVFCENCFHRYVDPEGIPLYFYINNITQSEPPSPIISQQKDIPPSTYCQTGYNGIAQCDTTNKPCDCFHVIKIPLHCVVNFILIDKSNSGGINHPFHLHGFVFNVIAMGQNLPGGISVENIEKHLQSGSLKRSPAPAFKDTIAVPSSGYAVVGIVADNPGYWLFHCHTLSHNLLGMSVVIQVGTPGDIPPVPNGFPRCMNYQNAFNNSK